MNGRLPANFFSFRPAPGPAAAGWPGWSPKRLYGALALSCLLHAALFFMPYLGASSPGSRPAARSVRQAPAVRILDVRVQRQPAAETPALAGAKPAPGAPAAQVPPEPSLAHGASVLPLPAQAYYRTDQLTMPPRPTSQPEIDVPRIARSVSGTVVLRLWISELGEVSAVEVEASDLPPKISRTAAAAFARLRFLPGEIDGRRVPSMMKIELTYGRGSKRPS